MTKNKVTVKINGAEYTLTGDESEDYLFSIANFVDKKVKEILYGNPKHSNTSSAVLSALTITDELFKTRREVEVLKRSLSEPEEKIKKLKRDYEELKEAYDRLKEEYESYVKLQQEKEADVNTLKKDYDELYENYIKNNSEYEKLIKENAYLREQNEKLEKEISQTHENIANLKDQLLESQIELVRVKKDLKDLKELQSKKRGI
ncbi:cell division protein ZapA [Fonticella tunisiensis]|uniref:Cell division protein ZapA n=1 Tax=Fonticella tunisiensis TaxID=1096341 RepID=A0A4R7KPI1_9CLOT|nr:cell division protein ZapA [Fonticella tunisiensis]TDT61040.1 cell division protein ZapA [Fonticella tunisiensis]